MTSFIAACGSGRFTSFIPAVPAAWSVTTIAFMTIFSSVICPLVEMLPLVMATKCAGPGHRTVPRLEIVAVPSSDDPAPHRPRSRQEDTAGRPDLPGDPRGHRDRAARRGREAAVLAGSGGSAR